MMMETAANARKNGYRIQNVIENVRISIQFGSKSPISLFGCKLCVSFPSVLSILDFFWRTDTRQTQQMDTLYAICYHHFTFVPHFE